RQGSASLFHSFDGLGSTDRLTNSSAIVTDTFLYQAFGNVYVVTGSSVNRYRYVGQLGSYWEIDDGRVVMRARDYQPLLQRFLSADPIHLEGKDSNLYRYSFNRVLIQNDPSGKMSIISAINHQTLATLGFVRSPIFPLFFCGEEPPKEVQ